VGVKWGELTGKDKVAQRRNEFKIDLESKLNISAEEGNKFKNRRKVKVKIANKRK
jgi:hypothetical protein